HFVTAFLREFGRETERFAGRLELPDAIRSALPTMSAGVIFAHYSFPYARAAQIADETLRRAKRATCGKRPAVAWVDVTVDGESPPVWRQSFELTALEGHADTLAALGEIGKSGRQTLARLLAHEGHSEEPRAAALLWARRSGHTALQNPLHDLSLGELRNLVALTRWWKP
ncbi:MAG: hypothetical protein JWL97_3560, partial [Gemmatimonadales bacterium]|nr:hypothetical protein [Gemmatimonadales bacterium]